MDKLMIGVVFFAIVCIGFGVLVVATLLGDDDGAVVGGVGGALGSGLISYYLWQRRQQHDSM